ncbi:uncharacterized protein BJ171DRAFT_499622 [Polychytrium aggregatum]|uniref:uncharacterized protein n=1 Tax=Polychytrium aggregatum TaxID=110093 RepID=UPI0022FEEFBC|nr:uncharacterized protein BJ171DRAFT_499622 [Polychytrium aggregatum]KAI9205796.1 hypothetical protein BJ171DRAFT_499622 [Polychytrium aggregatum]
MGKLNILQHKSWHVYSRENQERVRRDEENARIEEEEKQRRIDQAEQEVRLKILRERAKRRRLDTGEEPETDPSVAAEQEAPGPLNLFPDAEKPELGLSSERRKGKDRAEKNRDDKRHAPSGSSASSDFAVATPWYAKSKGDQTLSRSEDKKDRLPEESERRRKRIQPEAEREDPMWLMNQGQARLDQIKSKSKSRLLERRTQALVRTAGSRSSHGKSSSSRGESKRHGPRHNPTPPGTSRDSHADGSSSSSSSSTIERLRAERLAREQAEKHKAELLLNPGAVLGIETKRHIEDTHYYHNQFNRNHGDIRRRH